MNTQTRTKPTEAHIKAALQDPMTDWCTPSSVEGISEYSLEIIRSTDTRNGNRWEGILYKGDEAILWVDNEGNGGCNSYHAVPGSYDGTPKWRNDHAEFLNAAKAVYPDSSYEQDDTLVCFLDVVANELS